MDKVFQLFNWHQGVNNVKLKLKKDDKPLRFGILSAAAINYCALIDPVQTHPGAIIVAIGARDKARAQAQIHKYGVDSGCKAYGSYSEVLADADVDAVYIPLPNSLHCEWAVKSMEAGKHVLIEKPIASNAEEARRIRDVAERTGKVVLEAFHWRFHPAAHRVKEIIDSGKYGALVSIDSLLRAPGGFVGKDDIRLKYELAGGAAMDGCYVFCAALFFSAPPSEVSKCRVDIREATPQLGDDKLIDESMDAKFVITPEGKPSIQCHAEATITAKPFLWVIPRFWTILTRLTFELEKAVITFNNFAIPTFGHSVTIVDKATGSKTTEKIWTGGPQWGITGEPWWYTYRYQLEAFIRKIRAQETDTGYDGPWMTLNESAKVMEMIDAVYAKAGLPRRGR